MGWTLCVYFQFHAVEKNSDHLVHVHGSGQGHSCGVAVDGEGNILEADSNNHRIQKFTTKGQFLTSVGTRGNGRLQFDYPRGLTFNATNDKVYVADTSNDRVQVLNSYLTFSNSFGKQGSGKVQFNHPPDLACDRTGKVYAADYENHRIHGSLHIYGEI